MDPISITALVSSQIATAKVAQTLWNALRNRLQEEGVEAADTITVSLEDLQEAEAMIAEMEEEAHLAPDETFAITKDAIAAARDEADRIRAERMRQARATFNAALTLLVVGVLIIFAGVSLLLLRGAVATGAITASVGALTEVISALLFRFNNEANNRLDEVGKDLRSIEECQIAMSLIEKIEDPAKRDDAFRELASALRAFSN